MFNKLVYYILLFFIFCIILYTQILSSKYDYIFFDDFFTMFNYHKGFLNEYFINSYHGRFITNSLSTFICVMLPLKFNIHPTEWMSTGGCFFKSFFIFLIAYLISSTLFIYDNNKLKYNFLKIIVIVLSTLFIYFFYQNIFFKTYHASAYMAFYGFTFPFIFYFLFWNKLLIFIDSENNSKKNIFMISLLSFLTGYSTEFCAFSTFVSFSLVLAFLVLNKYKNLKYIVIFYIFNLFGFLLYTLLPGFQIEANQNKLLLFLSFYKDFDTWFIEVIQGLKNVFVPNLLVYFLIIIFLFFTTYFMKIENKAKKIF